MGKTRAYKHRLDKYYHLAHAVGYRSRAAFKLIQLNQQYDFLTNATYCLDLCAAPGGWSQVAAKYMPTGSTVIAIDLSPIKPIPHVITLQADITSPKTQAKVRKIMQGNRCDVVLNDGAPNVGAAWITDSTNQLDLCLASLKFATIFLKKGGSFVTKVFRSEHYNSLLWVLNQFFEQVIPTKPKASRDTSAELFIVCKNYSAPTNVDPRMLDPQYVFSDLDELTQKPLPNAEAIETKTAMDFTSYKISNFLRTENPLEILNAVNELTFNDPDPIGIAAKSDPRTNEEIKTLCKDLKVVGLADKKVILKWRRQMRASYVVNQNATTEAEAEDDGLDSEDEDDEDLQEALKELQLKQRKQIKSERKKKEKMRNNLIKRFEKNMSAPSANADMLDPATRFGKMYTPVVQEDDLSHLTYEQITELNIENQLKKDEEEGRINRLLDDEDGEIMGPQPKLRNFNIKQPNIPETISIPDEEQNEGEEEEEEVNEELTPVQRKALEKQSKEQDEIRRKTNQWFSNPTFDDDDEDDEDEDPAAARKALKEELKAKQRKEEQLRSKTQNTEEDFSENESESDGEPYYGQSITDFDALTYKIARDITTSRHKRTEFINDSFNRHMHDDGPGVPAWFANEEAQYNKPMIPLTKQDVAEWRQKMRAINEVETKRVIEARARKKAKVLQKLKSAQEKADEIAEKEGLDERSKLRMLEQITARGMAKLRQKETVVVVRKKDNGNPTIPRGKGKVRLVDSRGKKDLRAEKAAAKRPAKFMKKKKSKYIHRRK